MIQFFSQIPQKNPNLRLEPGRLRQPCTDCVWLTQEVLTLALTFITGTEIPDAILMKPFHKYTNEPQSQLGPLAHSAGQRRAGWMCVGLGGGARAGRGLLGLGQSGSLPCYGLALSV